MTVLADKLDRAVQDSAYLGRNRDLIARQLPERQTETSFRSAALRNRVTASSSRRSP